MLENLQHSFLFFFFTHSEKEKLQAVRWFFFFISCNHLMKITEKQKISSNVGLSAQACYQASLLAAGSRELKDARIQEF